MQHEDSDRIVITSLEAGVRLDKILASRYSDVRSRTYFQSLLEQEAVLLNGEPVKKRIKPKEGDEVEIYFKLTPELDLQGENIPLEIIYEDEDLLVVNKPAGLVVHPAPGNWSGTFVNALIYHCKNLERDQSTIRPGIVHRLDKDTSGLLIAAKNLLTQQRLIEMFSSRRIHKEYLAVCVGNPGTVDIKFSIGRHPVHRKMMTVCEEKGRNALSLCTTLSFNGQLSLVKIILATGRTHQIRVHLLHHGTPVLGDSVYGSAQANRKYGVKRQLLHAYRLLFNHPITEKPLEFIAPLPTDMQHFAHVIFPEGKVF